jgi:hypothetical protein
LARFGAQHRSTSEHRSSSTLDGRRLWEVGSWGNASDQIGRRWEELGLPAIQARLPLPLADADGDQTVVSLVHDDEFQSGLKALGLTNPDAILVEQRRESLVLRPVDFKWSIETASYKQISAPALTELLRHERSPLAEHLGGSLGTELVLSRVSTADGLFVAPDSLPNRRFIGSTANHRQEYPIQSADVVWEPVVGREFFGDLQWWWLAEQLAGRDHSESSLETLDGAERYYRLGAGVGGALSRTNTPIFGEESAELDIRRLVDAFFAASPGLTSEAAISQLQPLMSQRQARAQRLRALWQCPYSFPEMISDLMRQGIFVPDGDNGARPERERWGAVHRRIALAHRATVNRAGMELLAAGQTEAAALANLEKRRGEFASRCRANARAVLALETTRAAR